MTIPSWFTNPEVEISYDASSPSGIEYSNEDAYVLPSGSLRVWTHDASYDRNSADVLSGGSFVAPGQYLASNLGATPDGLIKLYVEAIRESMNVADQAVNVVITDGATGRVMHHEFRFTATRVEVEGRGLDGDFHPVDHYVASTLTSGAPGTLSEAWQTYRVNVYDPRQTGVSTFQIEGQTLALKKVGEHYETPEFFAITTSSSIPQGLPYVVLSDDDADWQYNPSGKTATFLSPEQLNQWDQTIAQRIIEVENQIENEVKSGVLLPERDEGWFGKLVHKRVAQSLGADSKWVSKLYVDTNTNRIISIETQPGNLTGLTEIDNLRVKAEYHPRANEILDATKVDDLYEIKTGVRGFVPTDQRARLTKILNGGIENGPRKIKVLNSPKKYSIAGGIEDNPNYTNSIKLLSLLGVALTSVQQAHAMWTFDPQNDDFVDLIAEARIIKRMPAGPAKIQATKTWLRTDVNQFIAKTFPALPDVSRGIGISAAMNYVDSVR